MINIKTYEILAKDDLELNIKRTSLLKYHIAYKNIEKLEGIVFLIPGFGPDANLNYQINILKFLAEHYNVLAVFVEYHAINCRLSNKATLNFDDIDMEIVSNVYKKLNIQLDPYKSNIGNILKNIEDQLNNLKKEKLIGLDYKEILVATLYPDKNEYQNFGLLQALDILNVLYDLKKLGFEKLIESKPIVLIGSSHGGYIANLIAKFAPNTFDWVIDNSSYSKPPLKYIVGKEHNVLNQEATIHIPDIKSINLLGFTYTLWSIDENSERFFDLSSYEIRDFTNEMQISQMKQHEIKTKFLSYHSMQDLEIAPFEEKSLYYNHLKKYGIASELKIVSNEKDIDGIFIKNLDHAMDISYKELIKRTLPQALKKKSSQTDISLLSNIIYNTTRNKQYIFNYNKTNYTFGIKENNA